MVVVIIWVHFVIPAFLRFEWSAWTSTVISLTLVYSAYASEVFRYGIEGIPKTQIEAAHSLGLSSTQVLMNITVPQTVRMILPAMTNVYVNTFKDTAFGYVIGVMEVMSRAKSMVHVTYKTVEFYSAAMIIYFLAILLELRSKQTDLLTIG